jgi:iron complex transport system ATP-binding protein
MKLTLNNLSVGYNGHQVLKKICTSFSTGDVVCLLGPNGCGKTTLFKAILDLLPFDGNICLDERPVAAIPRRERALMLAYVPQLHIPPFPFTALDVVLTGRTPFIGLFSSPSKEDTNKACDALELLNIGHLGARDYARLSGGERQMVLISRALAQSPQFLIMDEPTSHLDFGNQLRILHLIRRLAMKEIGIIFTTHAPDHAFACASRVVAILDGGIVADGLPQEVLTQSVLSRMYRIKVDIHSLPNGRCVCTSASGGICD